MWYSTIARQTFRQASLLLCQDMSMQLLKSLLPASPVSCTASQHDYCSMSCSLLFDSHRDAVSRNAAVLPAAI